MTTYDLNRNPSRTPNGPVRNPAPGVSPGPPESGYLPTYVELSSGNPAPSNHSFLPKGWSDRPVSVFVGGSSRPLTNLVAYAVAETLDTKPFWLDIREPHGPVPVSDPARLGWIPSDRLFVSEQVGDLEPQDTVANAALWSIIRTDEPESVLSHLADLLRLPTLLQEVVGRATPTGTRRALGIANMDRAAHLYPGDPEALRVLLKTLLSSSLSIVGAYTGKVGTRRFAFDLVYSVEADGQEDWRDATISCEQGLAPLAPAIAEPRKLSEIPALSRVFARTLGQRPGGDGSSS